MESDVSCNHDEDWILVDDSYSVCSAQSSDVFIDLGSYAEIVGAQNDGEPVAKPLMHWKTLKPVVRKKGGSGKDQKQEDFVIVRHGRPRTGQFMRNVRKYRRTSVAVSRGNTSKKTPWYYSRIGGGQKGRKKLGNISSPPICCPCHPPTKNGYNRRLQAKLDAKRAIKAYKQNKSR